MNDWDKLKTAKPINRLAGIVTSGGSEIPDPDAYPYLDPIVVKKQAMKERKKRGLTASKCRDAIVQEYGYRDFNHFQRMLSRRGEYVNSADHRSRKRAQLSAKRQAKEYSQKWRILGEPK